MEDIELILINISGDDKPGVTSALTEILARHNAQILDIGQSDIHHKLSLGILFRTTADMSGDIMKDLLFKCYDLLQWTIMRHGWHVKARADGLSRYSDAR